MIRHAIVLVVLATAALFAADFPPPPNTEKDKSATPMPAEEAAAKFKVPPGFKVSVFASEPDVQNPIACCWDPQGRLWVAENYTYEAYKFNLDLRDRIVIFKDNGIGKKPDRKVFCDTLQCLTSIEVGLGGVWAMCPPRLLFIPMKDDQPTGPPEVVLDGFTVPKDNYHNFANGLKWGPDGWLYGRCGASAPGEIGPPGTAMAQRIPLRGGIWRYHPKRKVVEVLCHGTTNPWGHDWDERGECFFINTVNGHLWHMVPGAHYTRPHTIDPNPYVYKLIDQHADHYHWDNRKPWEDSRKADPEHDKRGGGHAHCGAMIYQGDWLPKELKGKLFTINLHGRRLNVEKLERQGSGFIGRHEPDILFAADPFFRGIELTYSKEGDIFILDWNDTGECHEHTGVHRTSGRIYRVRWTPTDVGPSGGYSLFGRGFMNLEWSFRRTQDLIAGEAEQRHKDPDAANARDALKQQIELAEAYKNEKKAISTIPQLVWASRFLGWRTQGVELEYLKHEQEAIRCIGIRMLTDHLPLDTVHGPMAGVRYEIDKDVLQALHRLAGDPSALVRLTVASTLQRLPFDKRGAIAADLVGRADDANDHNLPLMVWYGLIPLAESRPSELALIAEVSKWPLITQFIARRFGEDYDRNRVHFASLLKSSVRTSDTYHGDLLTGMSEGLRGRQKVSKPLFWDEFAEEHKDSEKLRPLIRDLSVVFGDGRALDEVKRIALDDKQPLEIRRSAVRTLVEARPADLLSICEPLLKVQFLNSSAVMAFALTDDPAAGAKLLENYRKFHPSERGNVLAVLASRPAFASQLLDAIEQKKIAKTDLTAFQARQIAGFNDPKLNERLLTVWGQSRLTAEDKRALVDRWQKHLTRERLQKGDLANGKLVFEKTCASCHKLHGGGTTIAPDLTGAQRDNLDYLLENIIDPSAVLSADYRVTRIEMKDGRVFNGIVTTRTDHAITLQLEKEKLTIRRSDIEKETPSTQSLMADGLLTNLSDKEVVDLFRFLTSF